MRIHISKKLSLEVILLGLIFTVCPAPVQADQVFLSINMAALDVAGCPAQQQEEA